MITPHAITIIATIAKMTSDSRGKPVFAMTAFAKPSKVV